VRKIDSEIKIVVITAISTLDVREESFKAGASYFLLKPYSLNDLKTVLDS
jgi:FixJ family two-component response regulator